MIFGENILKLILYIYVYRSGVGEKSHMDKVQSTNINNEEKVQKQKGVVFLPLLRLITHKRQCARILCTLKAYCTRSKQS